MPTDRLARLRALIEQMRSETSAWGYFYCSERIKEWAAELESVLADPPQAHEEEDQARVEPSVPCVETTGSTAEPSPGAVTAAERTEKA